ncbi:MAG: hypothetical protein U1E57_00895 [Paenacidovorax caeni]
MHATPASAADAEIPPQRTDDTPPNVIDTLYQAALGPTGAPHYLPRFEIFDPTHPLQVNGGCRRCTLGWLLYRRLWLPALVYACTVEGLVLLWFAALRPWLQPPLPIEAGLGLALLVLSCALPGLWGDALVYTDIRKRTLRALDAAPSVAQAHTALAQVAPTLPRLYALAGLYVALGAASRVQRLWVPRPRTKSQPAWPTQAATVLPRMPASAPAPSPWPSRRPAWRLHRMRRPHCCRQRCPRYQRPPAAAPAAPHAPAAATAAPAAHAARARGAARRDHAQRPSPRPQPPNPPQRRKPAPRRRRASAPGPAARRPRRHQTPSQRPCRPSAITSLSACLPTTPTRARWDKQLRQAKSPPRCKPWAPTRRAARVRAGPFRKASEARAAARRIRAMGLEAVVFQQR